MSARDLVPPVPPATKADLEAIDEQLRQALDPLVCAKCQRDVPTGDAFTLDGATYDAGCAFEIAALWLSDFLSPAFSPVELTEKRYAEAWRVVESLRARVLVRMAEAARVGLMIEGVRP
ncbi:MAG TPA: hypothetical protein VIV57_20895 [Anaeromyxobacter sp.]